ncbi:MAG: glycosyltransferase family 39 protein [Candidatus Sumerlaeaceae bacterium]|nr:glycosyltransferase family 39 protein [Candidatus Sumerlaeaceae bacterium]
MAGRKGIKRKRGERPSQASSKTVDQVSVRRSPLSSLLRQGAIGFLLVALIIAAARTLWSHLQILRYPYEANFGEGGLLYDALLMARHSTLYAPAELGGWLSPYPPLYAWLVSFWPTETFFFPRLISQVSHMGSGIVLLVVLRRLGINGIAALSAALMWYANPFIRTFAAMGRVDMLGRFLEGLSVAIGAVILNRRGSVVGASILSVLALATKQTMFAGILNLVGYWFREDRTRAVRILQFWLIGTVISYIFITFAFGRSFLTNVFVDVKRSLSLGMWWPWVVGFFLCNIPTLGFAAYALKLRKHSLAFRLGVWATLAGLPSMLLAAQDGADVNYFFDLTWGICVLAAVGIDSMITSRGPSAPTTLFVMSLIAVALDWAIPPRYPTQQQRKQAKEVEQILLSAPKPVLCEFVGFGLKVGSAPIAVPYIDKKLEETGRRLPERAIEYISEKRFGAVQVTSQAGARWPAALLRALETHYEQQYVFPSMFAAEGEPDFAIFLPKRVEKSGAE